MMNTNKFEEININDCKKVNGGLVAGALAGAVLGGAAGLLVACGIGIVNGELSGKTVWKCYTAGALTGAAIGAYTPV